MKAYSEEIIFQNDGFMNVRHLTLSGTQIEIGNQLTEIARKRHGFTSAAIQSFHPVLTRARRQYFLHSYPLHLERARGVAQALGIDPLDDAYDPTDIAYNQGVPHPGCSVVYYPPQTTQPRKGYVSSNYDFPTGSLSEIMGIPGSSGNNTHPVMGDPYILEMYPEGGGYNSLSMISFELLSGVLQGINSEGLMVSILGDETAPMDPVTIAQPYQRIGLHELQGMRLILDTCATATEAQMALLVHKHYFAFMPCHYIIADEGGNSFVFEHSHTRNEEYIIQGTDTPFVVTNHLLHEYPSVDTFPKNISFLERGTSSFERYYRLHEILQEKSGPYSTDFMKETNESVSVSHVVSWLGDDIRESVVQSPGLARTLWHNLICSHDRSMEIKFYTGEITGEKGKFTEEYTDYFTIILNE